MTTRSARQADPQADLLVRLGLDGRATSEEIAETHDELVSFLTTAPRSLRSWARTQAAAADEAFAILTDPDASTVAGALSAPAARPTVQPDGPATPPARRAPRPHQPPPDDLHEAPDSAERTFEDMLAEVTPGTHRESLAPRRTKVVRAPQAVAPVAMHTTSGGSSLLRRVVVIAVIAVGAVAIAIGGYQLGGSPAAAGIPAASQAAQPSPALDQAAVADLMAAVQKDPSDTVALMKLGDEFYRAGDYAAAVTWFRKILDISKTDIRARLALGAAYFNLGDMDSAETAWLAVLTQDPSNVEAHYDLGFLYLNRDPADMDGVRREWGEVVRLAPDSDVAKTVKAHLDALSSAAPSAPASGAPSAPASAAPSAGSSAAPSAAPSSSVQP